MAEFELRLLTTVADITANGLQRASLYDQSLQQTQELLNAYNATLEGWALALELRDKETQGHSKRIAEQTIRLARRMGLLFDTYLRKVGRNILMTWRTGNLFAIFQMRNCGQ